MPGFAHLHVHSEYSLLDALPTVDALCARAAELGQPALGLTDHGVMSGAFELARSAAWHGIKPIVGCEVYFVDDRRDRGPGRVERNHLTLLASTPTGYRNLAKLSTAGFLEGWYEGKPAVDMECLAGHAEGVLALTGCVQSRLSRRLLDGRVRDARAHADELLEVFGADNVYFEVLKTGLPGQDYANEGTARIARAVGRPLVATADAHYLRREDRAHHDALRCVAARSTLGEPMARVASGERFLKSSEEMAQAFAECPEAIATTMEIAGRCDAGIELGQDLLPAFPTPDGQSERDYLGAQVRDGLCQRYGDPPPGDVVERMRIELDAIGRVGWESYFLIVWDAVRHAKERGVAVGPGRGSAAGSIVNFALGITDVDPLRHDLLFERFFSPVGPMVFDVDVDVSASGRDEVVRHMVDRYGCDRVAQVMTFGRRHPRGALRAAARVLGHDDAVGDRLAGLVPDPVVGLMPRFEDCLKPDKPLRREADADTTAKQVVDVAAPLDGIVDFAAAHACAVVIGDRPLADVVPLRVVECQGPPTALILAATRRSSRGGRSSTSGFSRSTSWPCTTST